MRCQRDTGNMLSEASLLSGPFLCRMATVAHSSKHKSIYCLTGLHRDGSLLNSLIFFFLPSPCANALPTEQSFGSFYG